MVNDLSDHQTLEDTADFLIIGAGTIGLPTACWIAEETGKRVLCLESGARNQHEDTHPLNEVVQKGMVYNGAKAGRFRCLGGTSTRWGGALIPFQDADLKYAHWPVRYDELTPYIPEVEAYFGLEEGGYEATDLPFSIGAEHIGRLAKWPKFSQRNVCNIVKPDLDIPDTLDIWLNANVVDIQTHSEGVRVIAKSPSGAQITITASKLIVAAGAIETTRLSCLIDQKNNGFISKISPTLGRHFTDHISVEVAKIIPKNTSALNKIFGFQFGSNGGMRNLRFEAAPNAASRGQLPPSFAHIGFDVDKPGGFDALRELFRNLQMRRLPAAKVLWDLIRSGPWLTRAIWWRFVYKRLLFPADAQLIVHMVVEQDPDAENTVSLSSTQKDIHGVPLAEIDWRVAATDIEAIKKCRDSLEAAWKRSDFSNLGDWESFPDKAIDKDLGNSGGIYHPTGSTRMGANAQKGVVNCNLQLFGAPHIQLLSTSVLPSGGGTNPTMMLFLLARRLVAQHAEASAKA